MLGLIVYTVNGIAVALHPSPGDPYLLFHVLRWVIPLAVISLIAGVEYGLRAGLGFAPPQRPFDSDSDA